MSEMVTSVFGPLEENSVSPGEPMTSHHQAVAVAQTQQLKVWSIVEEAASDLRRKMTRKYQVDF